MSGRRPRWQKNGGEGEDDQDRAAGNAAPREDRAQKEQRNRRCPDGQKLGLIGFPGLENCHPALVLRNL
jgi:hypothetical protein